MEIGVLKVVDVTAVFELQPMQSVPRPLLLIFLCNLHALWTTVNSGKVYVECVTTVKQA